MKAKENRPVRKEHLTNFHIARFICHPNQKMSRTSPVGSSKSYLLQSRKKIITPKSPLQWSEALIYHILINI